MLSFILLLLQHGTGNRYIENFNQGTHEESRNDGADTSNGGNILECTATQQEQAAAGENANQVGHDAAVLELCHL